MVANVLNLERTEAELLLSVLIKERDSLIVGDGEEQYCSDEILWCRLDSIISEIRFESVDIDRLLYANKQMAGISYAKNTSHADEKYLSRILEKASSWEERKIK